MLMSVVAFPFALWKTNTSFSFGSPFSERSKFFLPPGVKDLTVWPEKLTTSTFSTGSDAMTLSLEPDLPVLTVKFEADMEALS